MAQCPNCHSEVKAGERFCGNCGARIRTERPAGATFSAGGKPTSPPHRQRNDRPAPDHRPRIDTARGPASPARRGRDDYRRTAARPQRRLHLNIRTTPTIIGGQPGQPPIQPTPPPAGGGVYTGAGLPSAPVMPPPAEIGQQCLEDYCDYCGHWCAGLRRAGDRRVCSSSNKPAAKSATQPRSDVRDRQRWAGNRCRPAKHRAIRDA